MRISAVSEAWGTEYKKVHGARKTEKARNGKVDSSDISSNARRLSETKSHVETLKTQLNAIPDIRSDKVAEVIERVKDGYYNSEEFNDKLAGKILKDFGLGGTGQE